MNRLFFSNKIMFISRVREFLSVDIDISGLEVNQCDAPLQSSENEILSNQITSFKGTHKCHNDTTQVIVKVKSLNVMLENL